MTRVQAIRIKHSLIASGITLGTLTAIVICMMMGQELAAGNSIQSTVCTPYAVLMTNGAADIRC